MCMSGIMGKIGMGAASPIPSDPGTAAVTKAAPAPVKSILTAPGKLLRGAVGDDTAKSLLTAGNGNSSEADNRAKTVLGQ